MNDSRGVNEKGNLTFGGVDTVQAAEEYGTPLYLMDENIIRENCRRYKKSIDDCYNGNGLCCYASKAFSCKEIYRVVASEGLGADVVSGGELYTAISAGFDPANICFHGNNKTEAELRYAVRSGVGRIICDSLEEIELLDSISKQAGVKTKIMLRVSPGVEAHTHEFIKTGKIDSKFGFAIATGAAETAIISAMQKGNLYLSGLHCHIGSQIFAVEPFKEAAGIMLDFYERMEQKISIKFTELNLGGGFGIHYTDNDMPISYEKYMEQVSHTIKGYCDRYGRELPFIIIEPGRSIVGEAGMTLYTIGSVKNIPNIRTYVSVDGGMTDNIRYALYQSEYEFAVANKYDKPAKEIVTVAGRCCESGDLLGENVKLQKAEENDILAVFSTGAYNYSMASNYNRVPRPPVVFVNNGRSRVIIKRETFEDIVKNDI